jgi:nucleotide-binding universal stress UspA family protein
MSKHKILIPLDGSEFSEQILLQVQRFLNPEDNHLILLRVASLPHGLIGMPAQPAAIEWPMPAYPSHRDAELARHPIYASQAWDSQVAKLEDELRTDVFDLQQAGYTVSTMIRFGDPAQEILELIDEENIDLVAMTTHGRTGLSKLVFGNVVDKVLHQASAPMLILRPKI